MGGGQIMNWFAKLSQRDRRALMLLMPGVIAILLVYFVVFPWVDAAGDSSRSIAVREKMLHKYQNMAALLPAQETNAAALSGALAAAEKGLLSGATPALQVAEVQQIVRDFASAQGILVHSVEFIPPKSAGSGYSLVGVSLGFTAGIDQAMAFLNTIQNGPKILAVDQLRISAANVAATAKDPMKKQVNVSLQVYGVALEKEK
jgi:hypothetical protein